MPANYLNLTSLYGTILYSGQLSAVGGIGVYTVPTGKAAKIFTATLCNTSTTGAVVVSVALLKAGDTFDGTHRVVSDFSLGAKTTMSLKDELGGVMLAEGQSVWISASVASVLDVVLTGTEGTGSA